MWLAKAIRKACNLYIVVAQHANWNMWAWTMETNTSCFTLDRASPGINSCHTGGSNNHQNLYNNFFQHYSKNPWPCGNCTFPNEVHHQGLGSTRPQAKCFPGSDDALTCKKHPGSHAEITCTHLHTPIYLHELCLGHGMDAYSDATERFITHRHIW